MIAAYCRVSSRHQKADSQVAEIKKWLDAHGHDEQQVQWYIDKETGKTLKRSEFERLQKAIFDGKTSRRSLYGNSTGFPVAFGTE